MHSFQQGSRLHRGLLYGAYCWLLVSGLLQFGIDVVSQAMRGKRLAGPETTLYYGLNTAYSLSQILFSLLALFCDWARAIDSGQMARNRAWDDRCSRVAGHLLPFFGVSTAACSGAALRCHSTRCRIHALEASLSA